MPVKYGFYGDILTQKNVSLEHLKPHSKGGKTELNNLVLASKQKNQARGNADIRNFANKETIAKYLSQFIDVKTKDFDGNKYINGIIINKFGGNKMIIKWIKKKVLKSIINDLKNEIPELKVTILEELEEYKDELLDKLQEVIKDTIKNFVASKINR